MKGAASAEDYISKNPGWADCLTLLRSIMTGHSELKETIKWGVPVFEYKGKNLAGIVAFKPHCALWFYQGALLNNKEGVLVNAQEGTTKALRQWRFNSLEEIQQQESLIKTYIQEAQYNQDKGLEIKPVKAKPLDLPVELKQEFDKDKSLLKAFDNLSLTQKREYSVHISSAKRETTKQSRLAKVIPMIHLGVGLHDKYR